MTSTLYLGEGGRDVSFVNLVSAFIMFTEMACSHLLAVVEWTGGGEFRSGQLLTVTSTLYLAADSTPFVNDAVPDS